MAMEKAVTIQAPIISPDQSDQGSAPCKVFVYDVEISPADFLKAKDAWKSCELCGDAEMEPGELLTTLLTESGRYFPKLITTMGYFKKDNLVGESIVLKDFLVSYKYPEGKDPVDQLLLPEGRILDQKFLESAEGLVKYDEENDLLIAEVQKNRQEMQMFVIRKKINQQLETPDIFSFPPLILEDLKKDNFN